jgi:hypothetical protein
MCCQLFDQLSRNVDLEVTTEPPHVTGWTIQTADSSPTERAGECLLSTHRDV